MSESIAVKALRDLLVQLGEHEFIGEDDDCAYAHFDTTVNLDVLNAARSVVGLPKLTG